MMRILTGLFRNFWILPIFRIAILDMFCNVGDEILWGPWSMAVKFWVFNLTLKQIGYSSLRRRFVLTFVVGIYLVNDGGLSRHCKERVLSRSVTSHVHCRKYALSDSCLSISTEACEGPSDVEHQCHLSRNQVYWMYYSGLGTWGSPHLEVLWFTFKYSTVCL